MDAGLLLAALYAAFAVAALAQLVWGLSRVPALGDEAPLAPASTPPRVSVIVAARDEARHVESAVRSLLRLDYPDYELVVVNDRSTDATGEILARVAAAEPRLQMVTIAELPAGWLGKNHALHVAARRATGSVLLFADADVVFDPLALSRAVALMRRERADHVAVLPELLLPSIPLTLLVNYMGMWGFLALRIWKTPDPKSRAFMGVGAFNMVSVAAYRSIGGHERIAMRPDDDLALGRLIKRAGFRQIAATGMGQVRVEWYRTLGEAVRAFRKNTFAALGYSAALAAAAVLMNLAAAGPFVAPFLSDGPTRVLYGMSALAFMGAFAHHAHAQRTKPWLALFYPVAAVMTAVMIAYIVARTLASGRIDWRGTSYSLDELRANRR